MQTNLKTRRVGIQLLIFFGIAAASSTILFTVGTLLLPALTGLSLREISDSSGWQVGDPRIVTMLRILMLVQFLGVFLIPSLFFAYISDRKPAQYLGLRQPWQPVYWLIAVLLLLLALPLVELSGQLNRMIPFNGSTLRWITDMEEEAGKTLKLILSSKEVKDLLLNFIFIAGFAAVGEELVFRGILQRLLIRGFRSPWAGIIVAAFFFSFFHMQFFGFFPRFLLGILLGALYWYSGSLWTAILAHFVYDAVILTIAFYSPQLVNDPNASVFDSSAIVALGVASAAIVAMLLWTMIRNTSTNFQAVYAGDKPEEEKERLN